MVFNDINWKQFIEKGDETSFSTLYNRYVDDLFSYGMSLGFQKETCKDAIQDTFYKLYISRAKLRNVHNATAYIFKSYKHRLIDMYRGSIKGESIEPLTETFAMQVTALDTMIDIENTRLLKDKVASLLESLTPNQREVVYLKYMIGLQHKEIGEILDIREESARKLLYRSMEKLREQVTQKDFLEAFSGFALPLWLSAIL